MRQMAEQLLHDPDDAADAVQETLAKLWHRRLRLSLMKNPQGYAMTTLKNLSLSMLRHQQHLAPDAPLPQVPDDHSEALAVEQRFLQLEQAISHLPPLWQQLVKMRYAENMSTREIAAQLNMSEENVNATMSRARQRLRNEIET